MPFLPTTKAELSAQNIDTTDFIVVTPEAYVDHPSFGASLIARLVESEGFSVAILSQPISKLDFTSLGTPKHAFLLSCGAMDSMVANYSVNLTKRKEDAYSDGGKSGLRPDRVCEVYSKALKRYFPNTPIIAGGLEPSLRRLAHYDYWSDSVMPSILFSASVDLIIYGMGEVPILELLKFAKKNIPLNKVKDICGTAYLTTLDTASKSIRSIISGEPSEKYQLLSSYNSVKSDKKTYLKTFLQHSATHNKGSIQKQDNIHYAVINPPAPLPTTQLLDRVYELPYMRVYHPKYTHIPAIEEVQFSIVAHRGCFGNCSFCALNYHQGKAIIPRSGESILREVESLTGHPQFKGYIHDVGGPSANFHQNPCSLSDTPCKNKHCIGFNKCPNLEVSHIKYLDLLRRVRAVKGVKKVFVRSGVRFDYCNMDSDKSFINELAAHHISGQLKVAPEHVSDTVLKLMNKPPHKAYVEFNKAFNIATKKAGLEQYLVPYFVSSHPGSTIKDAVQLTEYLISIRYEPEQVQDFYPTPGTLSTAMYYTELDPTTFKKLFVPKTKEEKVIQRALLQYRRIKNRHLVVKALKLAGREDLLAKIKFR